MKYLCDQFILVVFKITCQDALFAKNREKYYKRNSKKIEKYIIFT